MIELLASVFAQLGDATRAARLVGTAEALREQAGMPIRGPDAELLEEYISVARDLVSAQTWEEHRTAAAPATCRRRWLTPERAADSRRGRGRREPAGQRRGGCLRCAAIRSRYQANEAFGVRCWVSKSTCTRPNRWW